MKHVDEDLLTLIAVEDGHPDSATAAHLQTCSRCRDELKEVRRVVLAARAEGPDPQLVAPSPRVWEGIASALGHEDARHEPPAELSRKRRRAMPTWLAVAAGVALGVGGTGVAVSLIESTDPETTEEAVVATAELEPFGDSGTPGVAEIRETSDERVLQIRIDERAAGEGFREVWLLDAETGRLVSLGVLNGTESTFELPDGLDLSDYPVVDVSREPFDGDPGHSTDSIARGELDL